MVRVQVYLLDKDKRSEIYFNYMASLPITLTKKKTSKLIIEIDRDRLERVAASLGLFRQGFLQSIKNAEDDIHQGKMQKIKSLRDLSR